MKNFKTWSLWVTSISLTFHCSALAQAPLTVPDFNAKSLKGAETKTKEALVGEPTFLIVNPSAEAGDQSKAWTQELRKVYGQNVRNRNIIAVDLPFLVTEYMALQRARGRVDPKYWDRTWLLRNTDFEEKLGIQSGSPDAHVFVLNPQGQVIVHVYGPVDEQKMTQVRGGWRTANRANPSSDSVSGATQSK